MLSIGCEPDWKALPRSGDLSGLSVYASGVSGT